MGDLGLKVDAIDLNLESYQLMYNPNVTYFEGDFLNWVPPRKYDLIMTFEVYEHIPPNEREKFIQKTVTLLNPGGILLLVALIAFPCITGQDILKIALKSIRLL